MLRHRNQAVPAIPDYGFNNDFYAQLIQLLSQIKGIGILPERSQKL